MKTKDEKYLAGETAAEYIDPDDLGIEMAGAMEALETAITRAKDPAAWAEKYHRSARPFIEQLQRITKTISKM